MAYDCQIKESKSPSPASGVQGRTSAVGLLSSNPREAKGSKSKHLPDKKFDCLTILNQDRELLRPSPALTCSEPEPHSEEVAMKGPRQTTWHGSTAPLVSSSRDFESCGEGELDTRSLLASMQYQAASNRREQGPLGFLGDRLRQLHFDWQ